MYFRVVLAAFFAVFIIVGIFSSAVGAFNHTKSNIVAWQYFIDEYWNQIVRIKGRAPSEVSAKRRSRNRLWRYVVKLINLRTLNMHIALVHSIFLCLI